MRKKKTNKALARKKKIQSAKKQRKLNFITDNGNSKYALKKQAQRKGVFKTTSPFYN